MSTDNPRGPLTDNDVYQMSIDYNDARSWDGLVPTSMQFYWKMMPPQRALFGTSKGQETARAAGYGPAPRLHPVISSTNVDDVQTSATSISPSTFINVRDSHHWTESPISARREVPILNMKEYRITGNAMLNQLGANVGAFLGSAVQATKNLKNVWDQINNKSFEEIVSGLGDMLQNPTDTGNAIGESADFYADPLAPYQELYTTKHTGFKYVLPYMQDQVYKNSGQFGGELHGQEGLVHGLAELSEGAAEFFGQFGTNMLRPGKLIEKPSGFQFSGREKSYTVTFPLMNTKSYVEVVKNWQFLYLLAYQNLPNRVNRDIIDPPCIYEAYIPGVWYSKYAAVTDLQVDFMGARREMYVPLIYMDSGSSNVGASGNTPWLQEKRKLLTVIPDAYQVSITITELFGESQNFKHQMLRESMNEKVRTGVITEVND